MGLMAAAAEAEAAAGSPPVSLTYRTRRLSAGSIYCFQINTSFLFLGGGGVVKVMQSSVYFDTNVLYVLLRYSNPAAL